MGVRARWARLVRLVVALFGFLACGTQIAQTAEPRPLDIDGGDAATPSCRVQAQTSTLPSDPVWGGGDTIQSNPLVSAYRSGEGPGIYIASRGGFRLYVNGLLLATGTEPAQTAFVPFTFLPGDNDVAVVATNTTGPPAVLVHVDELEKAHASAIGNWKASSHPGADWRSAGFDDGGWPAATEYGAFGSQPGCDPVTIFPGDSEAHWIGGPDPGAGAVALRWRLRIAAIGFGADATGGGNAPPTLVTTWQELTATAMAVDPRVIVIPEGVFDVRPTGADVKQQMTCPVPCSNDPTQFAYTVVLGTFTCALQPQTIARNDRVIAVASNKTIVGLGRGALVRGGSFLLNASQNIILRNLAIYDVNPSMIEAGDAVTIASSTHVWLDHLTYRWISDGFTDVSAGSGNITASWIHFDGNNELECGSRHVRASMVTSSTITFHHDWWDNDDGRAPLVSGDMAQAHLFNNVWNDNPSYAVGSACSAQALVEADYLENVATPTVEEAGDSCPNMLGQIDAPAGTNVYVGVGSHRQGSIDGPEPHDTVFAPPYAYTPDPASSVNMLVRSRARAGAQWPLSLERN